MRWRDARSLRLGPPRPNADQLGARDRDRRRFCAARHSLVRAGGCDHDAAIAGGRSHGIQWHSVGCCRPWHVRSIRPEHRPLVDRRGTRSDRDDDAAEAPPPCGTSRLAGPRDGALSESLDRGGRSPTRRRTAFRKWEGGRPQRDLAGACPAWPGATAPVQELVDLALTTPDLYNRDTSRKQFLESVGKRNPPAFGANNRVMQLEAMMGHDVAAPFGGSMERAAQAMKAKMLVVVNVHDHMVIPGPAVDFAKLAKAELVELRGDCGHRAPSCEQDRVGAAIARFLEAR
jgi:hypothetical protein